MITVVGDTHGETDHRLAGRTLAAVREADLVVHTGDLATPAVLESFRTETERFVAVRGNNDGGIDELPLERVVDHGAVRLAIVHGHRHGRTAGEMYAREVGADLLIVGHSHDPGFSTRGEIPRLNPGSHAHPRWYRPAHAELTVDTDRLRGRLVDPDGSVFDRFALGLTE